MGLATPPPDLQQRLAPLELLEASTGKQVRLGDGWEGQTLVLVHLRHFGCLFCRKQVDLLLGALPQFEAHGAQLVAIGTGDVAYGKKFAEEFKLTFPVLIDPTMESYRQVGAVETNLVTWARPSNMMMVVKTMQLGYRQGKAGPNQSFLGATHVIAPERVVFSWINEDFSSDAPVPLVLNALEDLADDRASGR